MKDEVKKEARKKVGEYLKSLREKNGISTYRMTKDHNLRFEVIKSIESGDSNYTIDNFLSYIAAIDCYFYLSPRDGRHLDEKDMLSKS